MLLGQEDTLRTGGYSIRIGGYHTIRTGSGCSRIGGYHRDMRRIV